MPWDRPVSVLLAVAYLVGATREAGPEAAVLMAVPLGVLVWIIWHPDVAADFTGSLGLTPIRRRSPEGLVRVAAWIFLLVPALGWALSIVSPRG